MKDAYELLRQFIVDAGIVEEVQLIVYYIFFSILAFVFIVVGLVWLVRARHTSRLNMLERASSLQTNIDKIMDEYKKIDEKYGQVSILIQDGVIGSRSGNLTPNSLKDSVEAMYRTFLDFLSDYCDFLIRYQWSQGVGLKNRYLTEKMMHDAVNFFTFYQVLKKTIEQNPDLKAEMFIEFDKGDVQIIRRFLQKNIYWRVRNRSSLKALK